MTTPHDPPTPDDATARAGGLPDQLWAVRFKDGSFQGNNDLWISTTRDPEVAEISAETTGGEPVQVGVSPARLSSMTARAEKAEGMSIKLCHDVIKVVSERDALAKLVAAETARADQAEQRVAEWKVALSRENGEIMQTLGKALGYPWFKDNLDIFPDASEANGICPGEHVAASMASEAARYIVETRARAEKAEAERDALDAMLVEVLSGGRATVVAGMLRKAAEAEK